ncbi:MAG: nucleotidyltransferase domain-containing protein [Nanoarchaeota archaeon]
MKLLKLLKEENARKIFGKKELVIIEKQLLGINLTQSEKNRLSRDIRKKFDFIKELSKLDIDLRKGAEIKKIIKEAVEIILQDKLKEEIKAILLFGSHVKGIVTKRSDIDICVIFKDISAEEATRFRIRTLGELPENVDIQVYNHLPEKIKIEIDKKGKILYKK